MTTIFNIDKQLQGVNGFGLPFPNVVQNYVAATVDIWSAILPASAASYGQVTVPSSSAMGLPGTFTVKSGELVGVNPTQVATGFTNNKYLAVVVPDPGSEMYVIVGPVGSNPIPVKPAALTGHALNKSNCVMVPPGQNNGIYVYSGQVMAFINNSSSDAQITVAFYAISD